MKTEEIPFVKSLCFSLRYYERVSSFYSYVKGKKNLNISNVLVRVTNEVNFGNSLLPKGGGGGMEEKGFFCHDAIEYKTEVCWCLTFSKTYV